MSAVEKDVAQAVAPVTVAREGLKILIGNINARRERIAQVRAQSEPARDAVALPDRLNSQRRDMIATGLRSGVMPDLTDIDTQRAAAKDAASTALTEVDAADQVIAELEQEVASLHAQLAARQRELVLAQFAEAPADIEQSVRKLRAAVAAVGAAYAELAGAGVAHCQMARELRENYGESVQAHGVSHPLAAQFIVATGFGIDSGDGVNRIGFNVHAEIQHAAAEALKRWKV